MVKPCQILGELINTSLGRPLTSGVVEEDEDDDEEENLDWEDLDGERVEIDSESFDWSK